MADLRAKALGYLRDGHVTILRAAIPKGSLSECPSEIVARIQGHTGRYVVEYDHGVWRCHAARCSGNPLGHYCAHIAAVQLVTGHPSAAAKP